MTRPRCRAIPTTSLGALALIGGLAAAAESTPTTPPAPTAPATNAALQARVDALETRLRAVESTNPQPTQPTQPADPSKGGGLFGLAYRSQDALRIGAYGEMKFGAQQNPDDNGAWQNGFDSGRIVLLPVYQITDWIIFNAEIEFEHGGIAFDDDDKQGGSVGIEQAYIDFKFNEYFNWRAPGVDVVPFGYTNLFHEPTGFYSVQRPELANGLIPTTWFGASTSLYGKLTDTVNYQFQIGSSIIDDGGNVRDSGDNHAPPDGGYPPGIDGLEGFALSRSPNGDFAQLNNTLGYALRISYNPSFARGLAGSTSVYFSPNVTPRHAYATDSLGNQLGGLGHCAVGMADSEVRYRIPGSGVELRGEVVGAIFSHPENLRANNDGDDANNVGKNMWGFSVEAAYHWDLSKLIKNGWELVPFFRYTQQDLQSSGVKGLDANNPTGAGQQRFFTVGLAVFPTPQIVLKIDYQKVQDNTAAGPQSDHLLGGVGFFF